MLSVLCVQHEIASCKGQSNVFLSLVWTVTYKLKKSLKCAVWFCSRAMQSLLEKKVFLISTLSADPVFILQHVQQDKIITSREYKNLNHIYHTHEKIVTDLLDTVMNKGDASCCEFMNLLQQKEVQDTFPELKELFIPAPISHKQGMRTWKPS